MSHNDATNLAKNALALMLSILTGNKLPTNITSKPVHNLKCEFLNEMFFSELAKFIACGCSVFQ